MTTFPTFVDVPDPTDPPAGAVHADASFLNALTGAVNALEAAPVDLGAGTANDTTRINAALTAARTAGRGVVKGRPGQTYTISAPLVIGSGTVLDMTSCTVVLAPASNSHMVTNYAAYNPIASATDGAVTSGSAVVTTALGAQAVVGQTLTVEDAGGAGNGPLIGLISARTATTVTLVKLDGYTPARATATVTAKAVALSPRDVDFSIIGGIWQRGGNGPNGSAANPNSADVPGHSIYLKHADRWKVDIAGAYSTGGISFVWPTDVSHFRIAVHRANTVRTVVQVVGPAYLGHLDYVDGTCSDDLINLCGNVYRDQTDTCGDVVGVTVGIVKAQDVGASAVKLNAGAGCTVTGVVVDSITGTALWGVWIGEDNTQPATTGGTYGTVDFKHIAIAPRIPTGSGNGPIRRDVTLANPIADRITIRGRSVADANVPIQANLGTSTSDIGVLEITWDFLQGAGTSNHAFNNNGVNIRHLILNNCRAVGTIEHNLVAITNVCTVQQITIKDCYVEFAGRLGYAVYVATASLSAVVNRINILGGYYSNGAGLIRNQPGQTAALKIANVSLSGMDRLLNLRGPSTIDVEGVDGTSFLNQAIFIAGGPLTVRGSNMQLGGAVTFQRSAGTETVNMSGLTLPCDLAVVAKTAGGLAYNTNAALSCGAGPVVCDGSTWKHLHTGLTY